MSRSWLQLGAGGDMIFVPARIRIPLEEGGTKTKSCKKRLEFTYGSREGNDSPFIMPYCPVSFPEEEIRGVRMIFAIMCDCWCLPWTRRVSNCRDTISLTSGDFLLEQLASLKKAFPRMPCYPVMLTFEMAKYTALKAAFATFDFEFVELNFEIISRLRTLQWYWLMRKLQFELQAR